MTLTTFYRAAVLPSVVAILVGSFFAVSFATAEEQESRESATEQTADKLLSVVDFVLANHIDPPPRQQMVLAGVKAMFLGGRMAPPTGMGRRVSSLTEPPQFLELLAEMVGRLKRSAVAGEKSLARMFAQGVLQSVGGRARMVPDHQVEKLLRENRYVGIGIVLARKEGRPSMPTVIPRGPTDRAGGKNGDIMVRIDDRDTKDMSVQEVVRILRGQEGKPVDIVVRQPGSKETRNLNIVRGPVHFESVLGRKRRSKDQWDYSLNGSKTVAYLKLESIRSSTLAELRQAAREIHSQEFRALVLDLRSGGDGDLRHAVMVADALLGECQMGGVIELEKPKDPKRSAVKETRREFRSGADSLFTGWPIAVLVDGRTRGQMEWIAAALKDNQRAALIGSPTAGAGYVETNLELPHDLGVVALTTGILQRADGKRLLSVLVAQPRDGRAPPNGRPRRVVKGGLAPDYPAEGRKIRQALTKWLEAQTDLQAASR